MQTKKIEPGINDFKECFTDETGLNFKENSYYVDKSRFIEDAFYIPKKISLFTRPRRFGKSMFLSMLDSFFSPNPQDPNDLAKHEAIFSKLNIYKNTDFCQKYMGKFPVLYVTFATAGKNTGYLSSLNGLARAIAECANRYLFLSESKYSTENQKVQFNDLTQLNDLILPKEILEGKIESSLNLLCSMLSRHFGGKKVILLVDEYDVPLSETAFTDYYDEFKNIISNMLGSAFKTNTLLAKGFITGCLRVAKESIFTGWNNFSVVDYDNKKFSSLFGFTDDEVLKMLKHFDFEDKYPIYKEWYDGYHFGDSDIYCPWDVASFTSDLIEDKNNTPKTYWNHTGDNRLAVVAFANDPNTYADDFEKLLQGQSIEVPYFDDLNYKMVKTGSSKDTPYLWSVLYMTGYLTTDKDQSNLKERIII